MVGAVIMGNYRIAICTLLFCGTVRRSSLGKLLAAMAFVLPTLVSTSAYAGSIRYDLPNLVDQHVYDGSLSLFNAAEQIDTPFHFNEVEEARLVVAGRVSHGQAHGDGVAREDINFELLPTVSVFSSFAQSVEFPTETTPATFRLEASYVDPFVPDLLPIPGPGASPLVSFWISLLVQPSQETSFPPLLVEPSVDTTLPNSGVIIDEPIKATIEQAYIVLSGASIVPEPSSTAILGGLILLWGARRRVARYALVVLALSLLSETCQAGFTFLTPTPYLSAADSPFPVLTDPTFNLEDFENDPGCVPGPGVFCGGGKFDAPGVNLIHGSTGAGASVDADDGVIDGSGADGASGTAIPIFFTPTTEFSAFEIEFDANELGFLPTAVGFVLTDGAGSMSGFTAFDSAGNSASFETNDLMLDPLTTSDDRFVGVLNPDGIGRIRVSRRIIIASGDFAIPRIDHLQYGLFIPEPPTWLLSGLTAVILGIRVAASRQRRTTGSVVPCFGEIANN